MAEPNTTAQWSTLQGPTHTCATTITISNNASSTCAYPAHRVILANSFSLYIDRLCPTVYGIQGARGIAIRHRMHCLGQASAEDGGLWLGLELGLGKVLRLIRQTRSYMIFILMSRRGPIQSGALERATCPWFAIKNNVAAHCRDEILSICAPLWSRWNVLV